jgi:hypothetical protein
MNYQGEDEPKVIGGELLDEAKAPSGQLMALGGVVLTVAGAVGISALETAGLIEFEKVLQVMGVIGPMVAAALGGYSYAKRG